ncbi:MAG: RDD family protein [Deltaproteobacteria bacterium]|nr:RDD family protein [Deltaproteobacteria bacterium]
MKHWEDLAKLAKTSGTLTFEALSPGLGLSTGRVDPEVESRHETRVRRETIPRRDSLTMGRQKPSETLKAGKESSQKPWYVRLSQYAILFFFAHLTDLVVVGISLFLAFWAVSFFLYGKPLSSYSELFSWLHRFSMGEHFVVLYSVFAVYFVIFKLLVGKTFGRHVFSSKRRLASRD